MEITAIQWKLHFLNKVKLCDMCSNPLPGKILSFASIDITVKYCLIIGFAIEKSNAHIREPKGPPLQDVMGSLSSFISTKMLVVVYM